MIYRLMTLITVTVMLFAMTSVAKEIDYKCGECHASATEVLPEKHIKKDKFEGCFNCHQDGKKVKLNKKVHEVHFAGLGTDLDTCLSCHIADSEGRITINSKTGQKVYADEAASVAVTLYTEGTLANSHKNAGLSCTDCHSVFDYDEYDNMSPKCKECHGDYPEMAKRTADAPYETNPHKSHFPSLACTKCHSSHNDFKDFCSEKCHKWGFEWKQKLKK